MVYDVGETMEKGLQLVFMQKFGEFDRERGNKTHFGPDSPNFTPFSKNLPRSRSHLDYLIKITNK